MHCRIFFGFVGFGIFVTRDHDKGEFLLDYAGDLLSAKEGHKIEKKECIYFFKLKENAYWYVVII